MNKPLLILSGLIWTGAALAQTQEAPQTLSYGGKTWRVDAQEARTETFLGREAIFLQGGRLWIDDADFGDGVIEFDAAYEEMQGFIGPMWRAESDERFEEIYFRFLC